MSLTGFQFNINNCNMYPFAEFKKNLRKEHICDFCSSSISTLVTNRKTVLWTRLKLIHTQKQQACDASLKVHISSLNAAHRDWVTRTVQYLEALPHVLVRVSLIHSVMTDVEGRKKQRWLQEFKFHRIKIKPIKLPSGFFNRKCTFKVMYCKKKKTQFRI